MKVKNQTSKFEVEVNYNGKTALDFDKIFKGRNKNVKIISSKVLENKSSVIEKEVNSPSIGYVFCRKIAIDILIKNGYVRSDDKLDCSFSTNRTSYGSRESLCINIGSLYSVYEFSFDDNGFILIKVSATQNTHSINFVTRGERVRKQFHLSNPNLAQDIEDFMEVKKYIAYK